MIRVGILIGMALMGAAAAAQAPPIKAAIFDLELIDTSPEAERGERPDQTAAFVREWADEKTGAEMMSSLPSLPTGSAWLWAPELDILRKVGFPANATFDSGKPAAAGRHGPTLKPIDLDAVKGKLQIVAKEAVENDPKRLKARIARGSHLRDEFRNALRNIIGRRKLRIQKQSEFHVPPPLVSSNSCASSV